MKRFLLGAILLVFALPSVRAQTMDDLNLQVHGYATQGFVYSTNNNWNTTSSTDGSAAWTEAVVNLSAQPEPRLRIGVQARYFLLGNIGNQIALDWAQADFKLNERFGIRAGKVKTLTGLLNDSQDIDPAHLWILLPQSNYAIGSRNSILAHNGVSLYGTFHLGESFGQLDYRAHAGQRIVDSQDQDLAPYENRGMAFANGISGPTYGGSLRWHLPPHTPLRGLLLGAAEGSERLSGDLTYAGQTGVLATTPFNAPALFAQYDHGRFMAASEYSRIPPHGSIVFANPKLPVIPAATDRRAFFVMASYKLSAKLSAGIYYSSAIDRKAAFASSRYQKDWTLSARYDFNPFLYAKLEQHVIDGTLIGFSAANNLSLQPNTRMTLLKIGMSF